MGVAPTLSSFFITTNVDGVSGSNQGGVMVSSTVYLELIERGIFDWSFRIASFAGNVLTGILPGSVNFSQTYINISALNFMALPGNGGFTAVYMFLWLGPVGVFCISWFLSAACFPRTLNYLTVPAMLSILMTFPRLHSYNFLITIKLLTLISVIVLFLSLSRKFRS